jgi:hypothetical protein
MLKGGINEELINKLNLLGISGFGNNCGHRLQNTTSSLEMML